MLNVSTPISDETRRAIKRAYGTDSFQTVETVVGDILNRYLTIDYFNPELPTSKIDDYDICEQCGERSKWDRVIDIDDKNLVECSICENCGAGNPALT